MSTNIEFEFGTASPRIVRIKTTDALSVVTAAGWLENGTKGPNAILPSDKVLVYYDIDGTPGNAFFDVAIAAGVITLSVAESNIVLPVVSGDFASFSGTAGAIADLGYLPSDATKTRVVMASAAVIANHIAVYGDTTGTINDDAATAINGGNIQAGLSGTAGTLISFPAGALAGSLIVKAIGNSGNDNVTIQNAIFGQASVLTIPDVGAATGDFVMSANALVNNNLVKASGTDGLVVDAGAPSEGLLQYASVAISAAEFNGMYVAPKLLVAAPAAGFMHIVDRVVLSLTYVAATYANGGVVAVQYDSTANGAGTLATNDEAAADFFATADTSYGFNGNSGNTLGILLHTVCEAKGLYLSNKTGAFDTGDGTWVAQVYYRTVAV